MPWANRAVSTDTSYKPCPVLTHHLGNSTARVLQQLHYWLSKENLSYGIIYNDRQWIRNSYNQWQQQIKETQIISLITVRRSLYSLEYKGIVLSQQFEENKNYKGGEQVKSYTIDYDRLESLVGDLSKTLITRPRSIKEQKSGLSTQSLNRAGDNPSFKEDNDHTNTQDAYKKRASNRDQMSTPHDQMSTPLNRYISNKQSNKLSFFRAPKHIETNQHSFDNAETVQPDKPAEREINNISEEMIRFWNEIVEENKPERIISLSPKRSQNLKSVFKQFFENDFSKWELFCHKITTCKFLMGEKGDFKASLDWAIRFDVIQRIIEGAYTFGTRESNYTLRLSENVAGKGNIEKKSFSAPFMPSIQESLKATEIRDFIKKRVENAQYESWFVPTEIVVELNQEGCEKVILCVSSQWRGDSIQNKFRAIYEQFFEETYIGSAEKYLQSKNIHNETNYAHLSDSISVASIIEDNKPPISVNTLCVTTHTQNERGLFTDASLEENICGNVINGCVDETYVDLFEISSSEPIFLQQNIEIRDVPNDTSETKTLDSSEKAPYISIQDKEDKLPIKKSEVTNIKISAPAYYPKENKKNAKLMKENDYIRDEESALKTSAKSYSSVVNDLKILQIRKKIKNLIPDYLYVKWFNNATILIEAERTFLQVPSYSIQQEMQTQIKDILSDFFEDITVVGEQSQDETFDMHPKKQKTDEYLIEPYIVYELISEDAVLAGSIRQNNVCVENQSPINVQQYRSLEPPDIKRTKNVEIAALHFLIDKVGCFNEKSRCNDFDTHTNDTLDNKEANHGHTEAVVDASTCILKPMVVNDYDPPTLIKEEVDPVKKLEHIGRLLRKDFNVRKKHLIKPTKNASSFQIYKDKYHKADALLFFAKHYYHRIRDGTIIRYGCM